jgi:hypothetical protein
MKTLHQNSRLVLSLAAAMLAGCAHKKPVLVTPQQPPATAMPTPTPSPTPVIAEADASQGPAQATTTSASPDAAPPTVKPAKKVRRHVIGKQSPPSGTADKTSELAHNTPRKVVPPEKAEPAPASTQISPGPTPTASGHDPSSTEQLLQNVESNLSAIKRQLTKDEETTLAQIKEFISLSHKATTENDPVRAHNLAVKARLLSDELLKQR